MKDFVITKALSLGQALTSHLGCPYFVQLLCRPWTLPHTLSDADIFHIVSALPPTTLNPQMLKILRPDLLMSVLYSHPILHGHIYSYNDNKLFIF